MLLLLRSAQGTAASAVLTWNPSTDVSGVAKYKIYRNGTYIAETPHVTGTPSGGTNGEPTPQAGDYYVSTTGATANPGDAANPWPLDYALTGANGAIVAGKTVWVRGGTYTMNAGVTLNGALGNPIKFIGYPAERPVIVSGTSEGVSWTLNSVNYVEFRNLEFSWPNYSRTIKNDAYQPNGACVQDQTSLTKAGVKFYNCMFKNAYGQGFRARPTSRTGYEFHGCSFYYNGAGKFDHGLYCWNNTESDKQIKNCFFHHNAGHDIHGYNSSSTMSEDKYTITNNVFWQTGGLYPSSYARAILLGDSYSGGDTNDNVVTGNYTYCNFGQNTSNQSIKIGWAGNGGWNNNTVTNNIFVGGYIDMSTTPRANNTVTGNTMYGCWSYGDSQSAYPSNTWTPLPPETNGNELVRAHAYVYNNQRGNIIIYNWGLGSGVTVDHATLTTQGGINIATGDTYVLRNMEDYFVDKVSAVYDGSSINVSMINHSMETPVGVATPTARSGFPRFGAFQIEVIKSATVSDPTQTYTDNTVLVGNTYLYAVSAVDVYGNESGQSATVSITF